MHTLDPGPLTDSANHVVDAVAPEVVRFCHQSGVFEPVFSAEVGNHRAILRIDFSREEIGVCVFAVSQIILYSHESLGVDVHRAPLAALAQN